MPWRKLTCYIFLHKLQVNLKWKHNLMSFVDILVWKKIIYDNVSIDPTPKNGLSPLLFAVGEFPEPNDVGRFQLPWIFLFCQHDLHN